jgi:hypothetical protein
MIMLRRGIWLMRRPGEWTLANYDTARASPGKCTPRTCHVAGPAGIRGRPLHQHVTRPLQVLHKPLGRDPGHCVVHVVNALPAVVSERKGQGVGDLVRAGGAKVGFVGHGRTIGGRHGT